MDIIISLFALIGIGAVLYFCWRLFIWKKQEATDIVMDRNISEILQRKKHEELEKLWASGPEGKKEYSRIRDKEWEEQRSARERKWALYFKQLSTEDKEFLSYLYLIIRCGDAGSETVMVIRYDDMINKKETVKRMYAINRKYGEEFFWAASDFNGTFQFLMDAELYDEMRDYARANKYEIKI